MYGYALRNSHSWQWGRESSLKPDMATHDIFLSSIVLYVLTDETANLLNNNWSWKSDYYNWYCQSPSSRVHRVRESESIWKIIFLSSIRGSRLLMQLFLFKLICIQIFAQVQVPSFEKILGKLFLILSLCNSGVQICSQALDTSKKLLLWAFQNNGNFCVCVQKSPSTSVSCETELEGCSWSPSLIGHRTREKSWAKQVAAVMCSSRPVVATAMTSCWLGLGCKRGPHLSEFHLVFEAKCFLGPIEAWQSGVWKVLILLSVDMLANLNKVTKKPSPEYLTEPF